MVVSLDPGPASKATAQPALCPLPPGGPCQTHGGSVEASCYSWPSSCSLGWPQVAVGGILAEPGSFTGRGGCPLSPHPSHLLSVLHVQAWASLMCFGRVFGSREKTGQPSSLNRSSRRGLETLPGCRARGLSAGDVGTRPALRRSGPGTLPSVHGPAILRSRGGSLEGLRETWLQGH